jgi:hypothetical protein
MSYPIDISLSPAEVKLLLRMYSTLTHVPFVSANKPQIKDAGVVDRLKRARTQGGTISLAAGEVGTILELLAAVSAEYPDPARLQTYVGCLPQDLDSLRHVFEEKMVKA